MSSVWFALIADELRLNVAEIGGNQKVKLIAELINWANNGNWRIY